MSEERKLSGLEKVCRLYGKMTCGDVTMVWDYANNRAAPEEQMPVGSERWKASERVNWASKKAV